MRGSKHAFGIDICNKKGKNASVKLQVIKLRRRYAKPDMAESWVA
jgi:hypothetical protein